MPRPSFLYGVVFDRFASDGSCAGNPDIAGLGVVLSFVLAAIATTTASIIAAVLDGVLLDHGSFLPLSCQQWLNARASEVSLSKARRWRRTLERLILSFADQQLVTGFALLISGYLTAYREDTFINAHWSLVVYLSCLSSSTHLAGMLTLRKYFDRYRAASTLRACLVLAFSVVLIAAMSTSISFSAFFIPIRMVVRGSVGGACPQEKAEDPTCEMRHALWYICFGLVFAYVFYVAIIQLLTHQRVAAEFWIQKRLWPGLRKWLGIYLIGRALRWVLPLGTYRKVRAILAYVIWLMIFPGPGVVFALQICFTIIALTFSFAQKFAKPRKVDVRLGYVCSLNSATENAMGFGQILALVLLSLPILSAWETYIEEWSPSLA